MLLTVVGLRILVRFARPLAPPPRKVASVDRKSRHELQYDPRGVKTAAFLGGITNGLIGAWGPVVTPFLLHRSVRPRFAIGCVNTAEVAVASASAFSLIASLGTTGVNISMLVAMLVGGVIAAPVAAWSIRFVPARPMGIAVAGLLLLTNARDLIAWGRLGSTPWAWVIYLGILATVTVAFFASRWLSPHAAAPVAATETPEVRAAAQPADAVLG